MGACGTVMNVVSSYDLNHQPEVYGGILEHKAQSLLQEFFRGLRE
jgi:tRNA(adenine34) deaminase